ncbi:hypothetical protein PFAG_04018 [Plasmodium falciparum Santa Lucia]|uniref:Hyaluronan/mRNA-binding protein domain-containing protein n=4 Tax=Plasmodium falciparum TaxID=5833 RepID=A0A024W401_PLAFA|nr:hypothetical protein PFTANZ_03990 [Plasmodium falciparum Tanzania (2000708)]ETW56040.1 hypothetical protein PFUGPA_02084 [Plasmodium falciparum Palo Alto/Uganda]ETW60165.1 hypothetical protein PFMC_03937 [Plasmodium falciparum CAMP/Malaysia]EUT82643.1 hypothetical protein PFAG_04018 [Plasmodium falciparum Santa Lucia]SOS79904.1 conserved Plasmodium protein, unknown function [Plasmodium sp. gorilla clade G1]
MPNTNKDKNVRLERHSAGKTPAYGDSSVRAGTGKYNWGNSIDSTTAESKPIDEKDPMYDSEIEKINKYLKK